ncbi:MAG: hypothetical protein ACRD2A_03105, partial [Vicinamibacterales bacterium]
MRWLQAAVVILAAALTSAGSVASAQPSLTADAKVDHSTSDELRLASQTFRPAPASPIDEGAWYPLTVTGGRAALDALGVPRSLDLGSTMVELVRRLHLSASPAAELNASILELSLAVADLVRLQNAVAAATSGTQRPTLAMAAQREGRKRLEAALMAAGLSLREQNKQYVVEAESSDRETALRARLKTVGVDVEAIRLRLMKGEPIEFTVPTIELPLPLSPRAWTSRILGRTVLPSELFTAILSDRRARLLYHGLVGMDANTRRWISNQRELLKHLYRDEDSVRSFSLFGAAIKVADGRMVVPGGPLAARRWATLLDADPARPDRFIRRVFDEESGRVAGLYFTAAGVDEPRRQFILGLADAAGDGDARFKQLASAFANCYPKQSTTYPFFLRSYDAALLLTQIGLSEQGVLAGPRWRRFWALALSAESLPDNPADDLREVANNGLIDAAWLVETLCAQNIADRGGAYETLLFGHRVFSNSSERELPDQLVAVRARRLYPAVVMAIEQAGIRNSRIYARLAQHADRIGRVDDPARAIMASQQFQGALALTIGTTRGQTVTLETGEALLASLAAVRFEDERYHGRLTTWLARSWVPAVRPVTSGTGLSETIEQAAAAALAGRATATAPISWEGLRYVVDFAGTTQRRLDAVRAHEGGLMLDSVLELER